MKVNFVRTLAATGLIALGTVGSAAHARSDVFWSVGVQAAPGVSIGVGNAAPVYAAPQPVYVAPAPVYVAPPPVVVPAPVYYGYGPAPVYYSGGYYVRPGKRWHTRRHHRHWN